MQQDNPDFQGLRRQAIGKGQITPKTFPKQAVAAPNQGVSGSKAIGNISGRCWEAIGNFETKFRTGVMV
jgi:hypothetical protein